MLGQTTGVEGGRSIYLERYRSIYIRSEAQQQFINFRTLQVSSFGSNHRPSDLNARRKTSAYHR